MSTSYQPEHAPCIRRFETGSASERPDDVEHSAADVAKSVFVWVTTLDRRESEATTVSVEGFTYIEMTKLADG